MSGKGTDRFWTSLEVRRLAALRAKGLTHAECGAELNRTERACNRMCGTAGLTTPDDAEDRAARRVKVREWHAAGLTTWQMVRLTGVTIATIFRDHGRLGLEPRRIDPALRGKRAQRRCREVHAGKTSGQLYRNGERLDVYCEGWPACSRAAAWHLDWFFRAGRATADQHAARSGRSPTTIRILVTRLRKKGWLACVAKVGGRRKVYDLPPEVRARRAGVLAHRSRDIPA